MFARVGSTVLKLLNLVLLLFQLSVPTDLMKRALTIFWEKLVKSNLLNISFFMFNVARLSMSTPFCAEPLKYLDHVLGLPTVYI